MKSDSKYPNRRAYVVKVRSDARRGALKGRVENLITCDQREFESARDLVDLIESDLDTSPPAGTDGPY